MSSYNPAAKAGFTKSGKSLKAVRRYYALLNQQKEKPKTPEDDKLSKRIAAELKTQHDANEKRSKRDGQPLLADIPTERSSLPSGIAISPKETGPVFITPPPPPPPPPPALKSVNPGDAPKSIKSVKTVRIDPEAQQANDSFYTTTKLIFFLLGLAVGMALGAVAYMLVTKHLIKSNPTPYTSTTIPPRPQPNVI